MHDGQRRKNTIGEISPDSIWSNRPRRSARRFWDGASKTATIAHAEVFVDRELNLPAIIICFCIGRKGLRSGHARWTEKEKYDRRDFAGFDLVKSTSSICTQILGWCEQNSNDCT